MKTGSRVGKGCPAGSIELRVSPSPSKIPYGGFSPVRLQMDRQGRPSTTSRGLSAVHIRPTTPSYTPPQLQLPGIRDPRRDKPFRTFRFNVARPPAIQHIHPEALGSPSGSVVPTGQRLLRPHPRLRIPPRRLWIRGGGCCTQGISAWGGKPEGPQFNPLDWARVPPPLPRWPEVCPWLLLPPGVSLHLHLTGSAITLVVSRLQSSLRV